MSSKKLVRPRNAIKSLTSFGVCQSTTATTLSQLGFTLSGPTIAPAKRTSVKNNLHLEGASDSCRSWHHSKNFLRFPIFIRKSFPGMTISSIQLVSSLPIMSSSAMEIILQNVAGAPVRPKGILRYM